MNIENLLKEKFNLLINYIELIGKGYDNVAYLVNNCYVFKIKYSSNKKKEQKNIEVQQNNIIQLKLFYMVLKIINLILQRRDLYKNSQK